MRRLAMAAALALTVALALAGPAASGATRPSLEPTSSGRAPAARPIVPRRRMTALDAARASVPLPRIVAAVAPPMDEGRASRSSSRPRSRLGAGDAVWAALARCESHGDPAARSADGRYTGAFQFNDATWQSLGHDGRAGDHPYDVQLAAAKRLQARSGWGQWPRCARRLGLLG